MLPPAWRLEPGWAVKPQLLPGRADSGSRVVEALLDALKSLRDVVEVHSQ